MFPMQMDMIYSIHCEDGSSSLVLPPQGLCSISHISKHKWPLMRTHQQFLVAVANQLIITDSFSELLFMFPAYFL